MAGRIGVIIPAAGAGKRLGGVSKPLIEAGGKPIILRLLALFGRMENVTVICIAAPPSAVAGFRAIASAAQTAPPVEIVEGGSERPLSVKNAFLSIDSSLSDDDLVCVHDAARPLLNLEDLENVIAAGWKHGAALLGTRVKDTLKRVDEKGFCTGTIDRSEIFAAQTPQVMKAGLLRKAYAEVPDCSRLTDEIMLMESIGVNAFVVQTKHLNFKITTSEDLDLLKRLLS